MKTKKETSDRDEIRQCNLEWPRVNTLRFEFEQKPASSFSAKAYHEDTLIAWWSTGEQTTKAAHRRHSAAVDSAVKQSIHKPLRDVAWETIRRAKAKNETSVIDSSLAALKRIRETYGEKDSEPTNFEDFKDAFVSAVQKYSIQVALETGDVLTPENFNLEFWTPDHIHGLSRALRIAKKRGSNRNNFTKAYLARNWASKDFRLCDMDRNELCDHVNRELLGNWKPKALWDVAGRAGLISKRSSTSGPKAGT